MRGLHLHRGSLSLLTLGLATSVDFTDQSFGFWDVRIGIILDLISLCLEHIQKRVGTAHKIRMISVDVCVLNLYELDNHVGRWAQTLI